MCVSNGWKNLFITDPFANSSLTLKVKNGNWDDR